MSYEDAVVKLRNFRVVASTKSSKLTIIENTKKKKFMEFNFIPKLHIQITENKFSKFSFFNL